MRALSTTSLRASLRGASVALVVAAGLASAVDAAAAAPPEIRSHAANRVPACVTPEKLGAFIRTRNTAPLAKFQGIGALYKKPGDAYRVRWDYAFYQMVIETNYLQFKRADGNQGDVSPRQNNFAGIGATGGGVPGDVYRDVSTGVLAQIQHLVAYSGERVDSPVAPRTRDRQNDIIEQSLKLKRAVTFADLRNRWAADRNYARSIQAIADRFKEQFCPAGEQLAATAAPPAARAAPGWITGPALVAPPQPATRNLRAQATTSTATSTAVAVAAPPSPTVATGGPCRVLSASYGGSKTVLIRAERAGETHFTALTVPEGSEGAMIEAYVKTSAPGGRAIGAFAALDPALRRARELCPGKS